MLSILRIKNLALVADLTLELKPGYNVITGETGAGKSILIGALSLVLGERADRTLIRSGADSCSVEAVFDVSQLDSKLPSFFEENGLEPCEDGQLVLKRSFTNAGANRQFVNGSPATLRHLAVIGESLVDIHGPHDHQSLLHPAQQLEILDAFGRLDSQREAFAESLLEVKKFEAEKRELIIDEKTYAQQLDLLRFQVQEIRDARLQPGEEEAVVQEHRRAGNAAKLLQLSQMATDILAENENSVLNQAHLVGRSLAELQRLDPAGAKLAELHQQSLALLQELQTGLADYTDQVNVDPARLQQLEERLNLIHSLKKKYGATLAEVAVFGDEAARKLQTLEQRDEELVRLNKAIESKTAELWKVGMKLSDARRKVIPQLRKAVGKQLADLGFKQSRMDVTITTIEAKEERTLGDVGLEPQVLASGLDKIEFQFEPNPGEPARPLRAIASSGELARVMLALKTALATEDRIPVLVFDEVDANVGGETANAVGGKMQQIASKRQVLCITHLPQVAAHAAAHWVAAKHTKAGRTISEITLLSPQERVTELARMLGGQHDPARKHAEALLGR
jgi:DNA repair protein RecN (Recombination protein N)